MSETKHTPMILRAKIYHKAALINEMGDVSALCSKTPRPINLKQATWTSRDEAVTCPRCRAAIRKAEGRS